MNLSTNGRRLLADTIKIGASINRQTGRHDFEYFDMMVRALGVSPSREILKKSHKMILDGASLDEVAEFVFGNYSCKTEKLKLNRIQYRLLQHIVYTFRRLLRQRDEGYVDSFLMMRAGFYCDAMINGPAPGGIDTDTLIRMLKDGSTDEEIMKWYIGDFEVI